MAEGSPPPYEQNYLQSANTWESLAFESVHQEVMPYIRSKPGIVLDVGEGSGRDAAWFASAGWEVVAVEPANTLHEHAADLHVSARIHWINDRLPGLEATLRRGISFDLIWLSAVWMHVAPTDRQRAFRKLVTVLKPGGRLIVSLRHGPRPANRSMHNASAEEIEQLASEHGLAVKATKRSPDRPGRHDVSWTSVVMELPDDGTGALTIIRGIILQDQKAATYKLALLRVIARIADQSAAVGRYNENHVELPLGLIALYWIRMYKPLFKDDIPQAPRHQNWQGLGFVKQPFHEIAAISPFEFRTGRSFAPPMGYWVASALADAAFTIKTMPARYFRYGSYILV